MALLFPQFLRLEKIKVPNAPIFNFLNRLQFFKRTILDSQQNGLESTESSFDCTYTVYPRPNIHTRREHLLQLMNLRGHSKSTVYTRAHSWCCTFCALGRMYNGVYSHYTCCKKYFCCPTNLPGSTLLLRSNITHGAL